MQLLVPTLLVGYIYGPYTSVLLVVREYLKIIPHLRWNSSFLMAIF